MTDDLTQRELADMTQSKSVVRQAAWLARRGIPFRFGGGEIRVRRSVALELPAWADRAESARPRLDLVT